MNILNKLLGKEKKQFSDNSSKVSESSKKNPINKVKNYVLSPNQIVRIIESNEGCIASDRITVDGCKVGFMYREETDGKWPDSGWRFFAGDENEDYMNNSSNHAIYQVNTICNYDSDIIPFLDSKPGTAFIRNGKGILIFDSEWKDIKNEY